jgi:hypothetical protein
MAAKRVLFLIFQCITLRLTFNKIEGQKVKSYLFVKESIEEMTFQELLRFSPFPFFKQLHVQIYDLQKEENTNLSTRPY